MRTVVVKNLANKVFRNKNLPETRNKQGSYFRDYFRLRMRITSWYFKVNSCACDRYV